MSLAFMLHCTAKHVNCFFGKKKNPWELHTGNFNKQIKLNLSICVAL